MGCWRNPFAAGLADSLISPGFLERAAISTARPLPGFAAGYLVGRVLQLFPEEVPGLECDRLRPPLIQHY